VHCDDAAILPLPFCGSIQTDGDVGAELVARRALLSHPLRRRRSTPRRRRRAHRLRSGRVRSGSRRLPRRVSAAPLRVRARASRTCSRCASPAWSAPRRPRRGAGTSRFRPPKQRPQSQVRRMMGGAAELLFLMFCTIKPNTPTRSADAVTAQIAQCMQHKDSENAVANTRSCSRTHSRRTTSFVSFPTPQ